MGFRSGTLYQGCPLARKVSVQVMITGVMARLPLQAILAAPRWNTDCLPGTVRVPSGKMIRLFPLRIEAMPASMSSGPLALLMKPVRCIGPQVNGFFQSSALTMQSGCLIAEISITTYSVPCDYVPARSWPLFRARAILPDLILNLTQSSNP